MVIARRKLADFLASQNAASRMDLGLVHSTKSSKLVDILAAKKLMAMPCNVFAGENLVYMFVGRPAYKYRVEDPARYWMLPTVFVIRFQKMPPIKRIFPFDSGAFSKRVFPNYIAEFDLSRYDLGTNIDLVGKLISVLYGDDASYLKRAPISEDMLRKRYETGPLDMEIDALLALYGENNSPNFDDRAATVELQFEKSI